MLRILKRLFRKKGNAKKCDVNPPHEESYPSKEVDKEEKLENLRYIQLCDTTTKELAEAVQHFIEYMDNSDSAVNEVMPNNWLKMHGKPMRRGYKRRKKDGR